MPGEEVNFVQLPRIPDGIDDQLRDYLVALESSIERIVRPDEKFSVDVTGSSDNVVVTGRSSIRVDASGGNVVIGGLTGGVDKQVISIIVTSTSNDVTVEHAKGAGDQDIYTVSGADETLSAERGGWTFECDGSNWYPIGQPDTGTTDHGSLSGLADDDHDKYIVGDGTKGRTFRHCFLQIENGSQASPATIKCTLRSRWNGDSDGPTNNIEKGSTTGNYTLSADGKELVIEPGALTGNCVNSLGFLGIDQTDTIHTIVVRTLSSDISMRFYDSSGTVLDISSSVDSGDVFVELWYITDA